MSTSMTFSCGNSWLGIPDDKYNVGFITDQLADVKVQRYGGKVFWATCPVPLDHIRIIHKMLSELFPADKFQPSYKKARKSEANYLRNAYIDNQKLHIICDAGSEHIRIEQSQLVVCCVLSQNELLCLRDSMSEYLSTLESSNEPKAE